MSFVLVKSNCPFGKREARASGIAVQLLDPCSISGAKRTSVTLSSHMKLAHFTGLGVLQLQGSCLWCRAGPRRDPEVICKVGNMWFNPKMPDAAPRRPKGVNPRAPPAQPLARQLAVARSAATFGAPRSGAPSSALRLPWSSCCCV